MHYKERTKVELGQMVSRVKITGQGKVCASRRAKTNSLLPCLNLVRLQVSERLSGFYQHEVSALVHKSSTRRPTCPRQGRGDILPLDPEVLPPPCHNYL